MDTMMEWLLEGPSWLQYRARLDLMGQMPSDLEVLAARNAMLEDIQVQGLLAELAEWPGAILNSHKSAGHPLHKLVFIADLGLTAGDPMMGPVIERILAHQSAEGPFQVLMNISPSIGGTGKDQWAWALCDAPLLLYALVKFGLGEEPRIQAAVDHLVSLLRENGWPCAVSPEMGKFRGPGRKDDPCPYANLVMLKLLAQLPAWRDSQVCRVGLEAQFGLWTERRERHPYMFYMGTDFCKLKAPLVWYDILHVCDVLVHFPWVRDDPRMLDMAAIVRTKMDADGRFTPESIWTAWKDWEFGQKRAPSRWLTLLAQRILRRLE